MLLKVLRVEWRHLLHERAVAASVLVFLALVAHASLGGRRLVERQTANVTAAVAEERARFAEHGRALAAGRAEAGDAEGLAGVLGERVATLPPTPLAAVSVGQMDLLPQVIRLTTEARTEVAPSDRLETPTRLLAGRFDLAFLLVYLLPLLVIAMTYDLLAGERERGTLALVLSQPVSLTTFVVGKTLLRGLVALTVVVAILGVALGLAGVPLRAPGALERVAWLAVLVMGYATFWFLLALAVNAFGRSSAGNALTLVGVWLVLVVLLPGALAVGVQTAYPPPSRVELVNLTREAAREVATQLNEIEGTHGGSLLIDPGEAARTKVAAREKAEAAVRPVLEAFATQLASQQRLVERWRYLSPAIVLQEGLNDVAGSGTSRHARFLSQVDAFEAGWRANVRARILSGERFGAGDLARLPTFSFHDEPAASVGRRVQRGLLGLLVPSAALLALGLLGLGRTRSLL